MANQNNPYRAHMKHSPRGIFNVYSINSVYTSDLSGREFANVNVAKIYPLSCPVADDMRAYNNNFVSLLAIQVRSNSQSSEL